MALVYRAWSHRRQDFAVIKMLSPSIEDSPMLRQRWETEAKLGQWLNHPSIARILDAGRDADDHAYLAMEYVSGQTIKAIHEALQAQTRRFPPHLTVAITRAVLFALEFVHNARSPQNGQPLSIVHRDLKPANVMITYEGEIKVLDFGVARVDLGLIRTQTGMLTGTPAYMSPEQVMADKRIDRRSDIYSWAAVVHEMMTGRPLVPDLDERIEQLKAVLNDPPALVEPVVDELKTSAFDDVLQKALAKEPEDRFETASAFWRALEPAVVEELGVGTPDELGRLVRSLFPGGLEKERLLREQPRARSAPLTQVLDPRVPSEPSAVRPQSLDEQPQDPGPLPPSPVEVPPIVSGYEVTGRLGEGGTGFVFSVRHVASGADRALKVLRPELAGHPDVRRRFSVEAQLGQKIAHPGVVRVFEVGEDAEGRPYMVMEKVEGQNLAVWLRRLDRAGRRMPPEAALRISLDVLEVLAYVHPLKGPDGQLDIVHRDLKPSNVMVSPNGQVKVLDFGIARATLGQTRTRTGYRSGTELYMSPEQALARKDLDHRSDIYSWGTVLFELVMGTPLLDVPTVEILPTLVHTPPQQLLQPLAPVAPQLIAPLTRALAKEPADRYTTAAAFSDALSKAAPDLIGLSHEGLGAMWQSEPPAGAETPRAAAPMTAPVRVATRPDPAEAATAGRPVIPDYQVHKKLDEGGCGELWLATKGQDARWWVIKTLRPDLARRPDIIRRFEREVRILAELDHPHVVRVHGARRTPDGHLFTVMEYIRGLDFERILYHFRSVGRRLPPALSLRVILDVLSGLHAAHELSEEGRPVNVVHRDLSPRNLMVDSDGSTKVIDFGLAAAQLTDQAHPTRPDIGTPRFWSPEQAQGQLGIDRRSDLYAIAVILYEALTGRALTPFADVPEIRRAVLHDRPAPVHQRVRGLPPTLGRVLDQALSKTPDGRFATAAAFSDALRAAWGQQPLFTHGEVASFLQREGPSAYRQAAAQSPLALERDLPTRQRAATHDGQPSDLTQDALHPPTRPGVPVPRPRRKRPWALIASAAAMVAVVVVLTATVPTRNERAAQGESDASAVGASTAATSPDQPTVEQPAGPSAAAIRPARPSATAIRPARPSAAAIRPARPSSAALSPAGTTAERQDGPAASVAASAPDDDASAPKAERAPIAAPVVARKRASPTPPSGPTANTGDSARQRPAVRRRAAASRGRSAKPPPSAKPRSAPRNAPAAPEKPSALDQIRRDARNGLEAGELLRRAAAAALAAQHIDAQTHDKVTACATRAQLTASADRVIRECGRWLRR